MGEKKIKVMIVEDDRQEQRAFEEALADFPHIEIAIITGEQSKAFSYISKEPVDVVILDLELEEGDGLTFLDLLKEELLITPFVVVTTNNESLIISSRVKHSGADFVFHKSNASYSANFVFNFIMKTAKYFVPIEIRKEELKQKHLLENQLEQLSRLELERHMNYLGIGVNYSGTRYVHEAILMVVHGGEHLQMKEIYGRVAKIFETGADNVERNIRTCIEKTWSTTDVRILKEYYCYPVNPQKGKPTNREFIFHMAAKIKKLTKNDI